MYDFNGLVEEVLRNRPEMTKDGVMGLVEEKKRTVGAGYLTDQGALFLVAGELGIQLRPSTSDLTLKDLYVGANDITIVARVLAVYPVSEYNRKDGSKGRYRRMNLFDDSNVVRLTIWDDNQDGLKLDGVSEDTPVRVSNGYVKQGLDGKPNLNLGRRGRIEVIEGSDLIGKLTSISKVVKRVDEVGESQSIMALEGVVSSNGKRSNFVRGDGSQGSLMQFDLTATDRKGLTRVVIWNPTVSIDVGIGQTVLVTNLRVKRGSNGEREFHGDSGTVVRVRGSSAVTTMPVFVKVNRIKGAMGRVSLEVMVLSRGSIDEVTLKDGARVRKAKLVAGDDTGEITLVAWNEASQALAGIAIGEKIRVLGATPQSSKLGVESLEIETSSQIEKVHA